MAQNYSGLIVALGVASILAIIICVCANAGPTTESRGLTYLIQMLTPCLIFLFLVFEIMFLGQVLMGPYMRAGVAIREPFLNSEMLYRFREENFDSRNAYTESMERWEQYKEIYAGKDYYILIAVNKTKFPRFVPVRAFDSPDEAKAFLQLAGGKVSIRNQVQIPLVN
jgi:hypothetical protein